MPALRSAPQRLGLRQYNDSVAEQVRLLPFDHEDGGCSVTDYPLYSYSDTDATFRVTAADSSGVHVRFDLDQDPEAEGYGDSFVIHIGERHQVQKLIDALRPCGDFTSALTLDQRQRLEAVHTARIALSSAGSMFSRGDKIEPAAAALLVAVAGFIATGDRDYLTGDGQFADRHDHA